ncbi:hypothetical protein QYE76_066591 [Lolium multiflorum]|uniref:Uncharacterized protein n=1 Tax=Lolium multiflorum TaxID=4521 RepID=A0AAD8SAT0_LOLMU|nr:hypothetical protein QYE76_066591 [Lolium multiflorum]
MAATAAHAGRTAVPGQAKPRLDQHRSAQHHHGEATESTATPGTPASGEPPRTRATLVAVGLEANGGGLQTQIDADHLVRHREASQMRPVSSPEMVGGGRNNAATAAATRESRERRLGFACEWRRRGRCDRPSPSVARVRVNRWATLTDCLNHLEEDNDNPEGDDIIGYEEPDLSGGVKGVDYLIVYGTGEGSGGEQV